MRSQLFEVQGLRSPWAAGCQRIRLGLKGASYWSCLPPYPTTLLPHQDRRGGLKNEKILFLDLPALGLSLQPWLGIPTPRISKSWQNNGLPKLFTSQSPEPRTLGGRLQDQYEYQRQQQDAMLCVSPHDI